MTLPSFTQSKAWQLYEKLPRPALRWLCLPAFAWIFGGCDLAGYPMDSASRGVVLAFIALVYGLRGNDLRKGLPDAT